jgi:sulfonate transport system ATP-binding protein
MRVRGAAKHFMVDGKRVDALRGIDADIEPGATVSVVGYSGCGKTTLLRVISGLEKPDDGCIEFFAADGRPSMPARMAMVFQEHRLLPWLTVEENMALALRHGSGPEGSEGAVSRTLEIIGIQEFRHAYPHQLSGGMAQRVALGRALCRQPDLLLMDEPFGALDALTRYKLRQELLGIFSGLSVTIILVTHDVTEALLLGSKVIVLERGQVSNEVAVPMAYPRDEGSPEFVKLRDRVMKSIFK